MRRRTPVCVRGPRPVAEQQPPPHPSGCGNAPGVPRSLVNQMVAIMPSPTLIQHEWRTHGNCSGLTQADYFSTVRTAYRLVNIPKRYQEPKEDIRVSVD